MSERCHACGLMLPPTSATAHTCPPVAARCYAKHPAFPNARCVLHAGHGGPHDMEGTWHQQWKDKPAGADQQEAEPQ
jgi:hypothetical protein